jgi:tRNA uridine 5-carboxymethylaminomethyl modification enzyme
VESALERLRKERLLPDTRTNQRLAEHGIAPIQQPMTLAEIARRPELGLADLVPFSGDGSWLGELAKTDWQAFEKVEVRLIYDGYLQRQDRQVERFKRLETVRLPDDIRFDEVHGLTTEARDKLARARPHSLGQASRLPGVTAASISALLVYLKKRAS